MGPGPGPAGRYDLLTTATQYYYVLKYRRFRVGFVIEAVLYRQVVSYDVILNLYFAIFE